MSESVSDPRVHTLSNGVRIVADPMAGLESCALSVVVRGGARWEDATTHGWSHLLEHMVFKGAGERSARDIVEAIENEGGQINAATGHERTSFQVRCLADGLPLAMGVLADLVRRPTLAAADLEQEKGVIAQEIAEASDQPDDKVFDLAQGCAFPDQPLGRPILGTVESLAAAAPETLADFHRRLYSADRIVVSAAGAVDEDRLLALAEAAFGDATPASGVEEPARASFQGGAEAEVRRLEQAHLVLLLEAAGAGDQDDMATRLFAEALGGGMSSRLFQRVREEAGLAYAIDAYSERYEDAGLLGVYAGAAAADVARTLQLVRQEMADLAERPHAAELARAKAQMKALLFMGRESPLSRAEQTAAQLHVYNRLLSTAEVRTRIDAVTLGDLQRVGAGFMRSQRSSLAVVGPKRAAAVLNAGGGFARAA